MNFHKVARQTAAVDFLITQSDFEKIFADLQKDGYQKFLIQQNFAQLENKNGDFMDLDFMFVDSETMEKIQAESQEITIEKHKFFIPTLEHLLALKLHSIKYNKELRLMRDLPDIVNLIRINQYDYQNKAFTELCLKFGTPEIYRKIMEELHDRF